MAAFTARIRRPTAGATTFDIYDAESDRLILSVPQETSEGRLLRTEHFARSMEPPLDVCTKGYIDPDTGEVFVGIVPMPCDALLRVGDVSAEQGTVSADQHEPDCSCDPCTDLRRARAAARPKPFHRGGFVINTRPACAATCDAADCWRLGCAAFPNPA